jgi:hypothetical protein
MEKNEHKLQSQKLFKKICRKVGNTMRDQSLIVEEYLPQQKKT